MLWVKEFGVDLPWREEVTTDDEDLGRDITKNTQCQLRGPYEHNSLTAKMVVWLPQPLQIAG